MSKPILDISDWQNVDDYNAAAKEIAGVILRVGGTGYGSAHSVYEDDKFETHYQGFKATGTRIGAYFYAGAVDEEKLKEEVRLCKRALAGKNFHLPIYYDCEAPYDYAAIDAEKRTDLAISFLEQMKAAGYHVGIYCSLDWALHYLQMERIPEYASVWIAQYYDICEYSERYELWQYTSSGLVSGIPGSVDLSKPKKGFLSAYMQQPEAAEKTITKLAEEVIAGDWSTGEERKKLLEEAGYDYDAIQEEVNHILSADGNDIDLDPGSELSRPGIIAAQRWLAVEQTGIWNVETNRAAIRQLQQAINLEYNCWIAVDGIIGPETMANMPNIRYGEEGKAVKALQAGLNRFGYNLEIDGVYGPLTQAAVIAFQASNNLDVDAIAGKQTLSALFA